MENFGEGSPALNMVWALNGVPAEADLLALASAGGIAVRRRCFDASELLAVSAVVPGAHVLISAQLARMSREIMSTLRAQVASVAVIALSDAEESLAQTWNADRILRGDHPEFNLVAELKQEHWSTPVQSDPAPTSLGQVCAIWGPIGSHGRTTFAIGLAEALADSGERVLLIDADTSAPSVALTLGIEEDVSGIVVATRYAEQNALDSRSLANCAQGISPNFWIMTGLTSPQRWPEVRAGAFCKIIERARENFDQIVIDVGAAIDDVEGEDSIELAPALVPRRHLVARSVLENADQVYLVTRADALGAHRLANTYSDHGSVFAGAQKSVVVNNVHKNEVRKVQRQFLDLCGALDPELKVVFLPRDSDAPKMIKNARTLSEQNSRAPLAKAIRKCADTRLRGGAHVDRVTNLSPLVKFFSIFRGHAHASAGSNG
ncbi:MAG: AAA family ATPase [Candidatus Nanopelagicales bacterium]|nr:AAA family ATPase [Actinomycetota bacterium]